MMASFADGVSTLLTTYDNCLALLKSFKGGRKPSGAAASEALDGETVAAVAAQSRLRRSIRSDRTRISRVYSSRLNQSGGLLEKGDARARSSLKRVLRRLSAALTRVLRTATGSHQSAIDYESLASLSNASRIDAIKAIDGLSRRISDSGVSLPQQKRQSVKSKTSMSSTKSQAASSTSSSSSSSGKEKTKKDRKKDKNDKKGKQVQKENSTKDQQQPKKEKDHKQKKAQPLSPPPPTPPPQDDSTKEKVPALGLTRASVPAATATATATVQENRREEIPKPTPRPRSPIRRRSPTSPKRISIASFASDNTKLGEVARIPGLDTVIDEEFEIQPVYPLRPYAPPAPQRKRGFWSRLAGRSS
ncbi:hypothetical protein MKZ38_001982 [Zalerion maritima]|uniref:Uncharacterized protein n=1 Tax=Zalerion maritima TaxID=339359 RepID=A0AAD5RPM3_9PEZI|nr:hypothetical protein MKZ38_001982 [Zalerion maritima]